MTLSKKIQNQLQLYQDEMVAFLVRLVEVESPSTDPVAQSAIQTILWEALTKLAFSVEHVPGKKTGGYLLAKPKNGRSGSNHACQLLLGHSDTVWPRGTLKNMPVSVNGNLMRGPGVYDMKAGLTMLVFALRVLQDLELETAVAPWILINSDEEIGSPESRDVIMALAQRAKRALVLEPALGASGKLKTARKGVGQFEVVVTGKAAHAGLDPEKGVSAILALSYLIQDLFKLNEPEKGLTVNVGVIEGGMQPNVIAPESRAYVDVRVPTQDDAMRIEKAILNLQSKIPGTQLAINGTFNRPPMEPTAANQLLWKIAKHLGEELGLTLSAGMAGGGSDGNLTSPYTATLDGLGAVGDGAHAHHEFIYLDQMVTRCSLLALLLLAPET